MMTASENTLQQVRQLSRSFFPRMREVRRYLHRRPELSGDEIASTTFLAEIVSDIGLRPIMANENRGLFVDLGRNAGGGRIAIRGDIDALPIQTELKCDYASRHGDVMHACGHDAHAAMAWGALAILHEMRLSTHSVRVLFQPEEETSRGGLHMIASGALEDVQAAIALHVDPTLGVGQVGVREGAFTAGCDLFTCEFTGDGGHGARPHLTSDLVGAVCQWVMDIYRRAPRVADSRDAVVVNVGEISAGTAPNVVPASASLSGTLRTLSMHSAGKAKSMMYQISEAIASLHGCKVNLQFGQHTPPVPNDPVVTSLLRNAASEFLGPEGVREIEQPSMGAEDFAFIANAVPAAMFRLGVAGIDVGSEPLHTSKFDIDEDALPIGASVLALAALRWHPDSTRQRFESR